MGAVGSLEVEPMFLACASNATWQHADMAFRKILGRASGSHALFQVCQVHGFEPKFRGADRWVGCQTGVTRHVQVAVVGRSPL